MTPNSRSAGASRQKKDDRGRRKVERECWVLVDADGYIYMSTVSHTRWGVLQIPHERGVTARRATLTLHPRTTRSRT